MTDETKALIEGFARRIQAMCPYCSGQGWYVVADRRTGEPAQEQCQWCAEVTGHLAPISDALNAAQRLLDHPSPHDFDCCDPTRQNTAAQAALRTALANLRSGKDKP